MTSPEEHIKAKLSEYSGVMSYDDFTDLATSVAHQYDIPLKEATALIHQHRGKTEIGSQEYQNQGFGPNNLWDGQDRAKNFGQHNPGDLSEPKSFRLPLSSIELISGDDFVDFVKVDPTDRDAAEKAVRLLISNPEKATPELLSVVAKDPYSVSDLLRKQPQLGCHQLYESLSREPGAYYQLYKDKGISKEWQAVFCKEIDKFPNPTDERMRAQREQWEREKAERKRYERDNPLPGQSVSLCKCGHQWSWHDKGFNPCTKDECTCKAYSSVDEFGPQPPTPLEKKAFKVGDKVRVVNNDQAPWGGEYKGIIERINAHNTFDIRDISTGVLNVNQPAHLLRNPLGEGRQDVRVQQRRVGDPKGMGEGQSDSGDPNTKREMPGMYMMPRGQEGKDIKNPASNFYKEAGAPPFGYKAGDQVIVRKGINGNTWVDCHCGLYLQEKKPGYPGQFYYEGIEGKSGVILKKYGSSHERSGFAFDCYDVLIEEERPYHLNEQNLDSISGITKVKVKEPSKEKLDGLKDKIKDAEQAGNKELAKQLMEQYMSLTATKKDSLYSFLFSKIVKEYGAITASEVVSYLDGKISTPSRSLRSVLHQYNIVAKLNVEKALTEVKDKTVEQINTETAWNWGSRAAACYQLANDSTTEEEKDKWSSLGDDYRHEALEHASLVEDEGKLVGEVSRALAPFRKGNSREGTVR